MTTYIYVYLNGEPLGFHDNWWKAEGKAKEFASFGGGDFFQCKAWEDAGADTEEEAELLLRHWLALKGVTIGEPIRSITPPNIMGPHTPHGDWTKEKVLSIVLDTLREMKFAEEDLAWCQWMIKDDRPLGVSFEPWVDDDDWTHFFPVFEETSTEEIAGKVRTLVLDLLELWRESWRERKSLLGYKARMAERFPVTYRVFMALN